MMLRYYETDWSVPCIENELLFVGTKEECVNYLFKRWSVDMKEMENNPELRGLFVDYLRHIEYSDGSFDEKNIDDILINHPDWDMRDWHKIDSQKFIYNNELVEEVYDSEDEDPFWEECVEQHLLEVMDYPSWEQELEMEIQGMNDRL